MRIASILVTLMGLGSGQCPASVISASSSATLTERSAGTYSLAAQVSPAPSVWAAIPGASWIWESNAETVGIYTFVNTFTMAQWATDSIAGLRLYISADNYYSVEFNGVLIAGQWTGGFSTVDQYELKPWLLGSSVVLGAQQNTMKIVAKNNEGPGGVIYKLQIIY